MSRVPPPTLSLILGALALCACDSDASTPNDPADAAADGGGSASAGDGEGDGDVVYDPSHVAHLSLEVSEESLATLRSDADQPMNFDDFTYVSARLTYDGVVFENVGLRVKGNNSRSTAQGDAVPFKLDMNRFVAGQKLDGQTKINLHNNVNQAAKMNDYLSYGAFRDFGIAASRTGWADITLNGESLGVYTLVEQVNEKMLARFYDDAAANLYKPEPPTGYLTYQGDAIEDYQDLGYEADNDTDHAAFLAFVKTIEEKEASDWGAVVDVDSVLAYLAGNTALGNWDTYTSMGHNYYLFEATPGRFVMLPWDMNLSQSATTAVCPTDLQRGGGGGGGPGGGAPPSGGFPPGGGAPPDGGVPPNFEGFGDRMPSGGAGAPGFMSAEGAPLYDGLITESTYFVRYLAVLEDFLSGAASAEALGSRIDVAAAALGERITQDALTNLRTTIENRVTAVREAMSTTSSCSPVGQDD